MVKAGASDEDDESDDPMSDRLVRFTAQGGQAKGVGWTVALLLCVKFDDIECTHDTIEYYRGCQPIHFEAIRRHGAMVHFLRCAGTDINAEDVLEARPCLKHADRAAKNLTRCSWMLAPKCQQPTSKATLRCWLR